MHPLQEHFQRLAPKLIQEKPLENYDDIQLTKEEEAEGLRLMREKKFYEKRRIEYNEGLRNPAGHRIHTAEEYYRAFTNIFPINENKEVEYSKIVKRLCCYFAGDKRFETSDFKLNRGILLFGGVGVGKTTLLQAFRQNQSFSYRIVSCRQVADEYKAEGPEVIERYSQNITIAINANMYGQTEIGFCFDDLGTQNKEIQHFGNKINIMAEILLNRYDRTKLSEKPDDFRHTLITTNLSAEEMEDAYGTRVFDRVKEMFNLIAFPPNAKSRRS